MCHLILRSIVAFAMAISLGGSVLADVRVKGYYRKNGTYVAPHYRSSPDSSRANNWSTKGNVNPYTGKPGTKNDYAAPRSDGGLDGTTPNSNLASNSYSGSIGSASYIATGTYPPAHQSVASVTHPRPPNSGMVYQPPTPSPPTADSDRLQTSPPQVPGKGPNWPVLSLIGGVVALIWRGIFVYG